MSRIRTVKPELFRHEGLFEAELHYNLPLRLAFIGLLTVCDREGRFRWQPRILKLDVLPHDVIDFSLVLEALAASGFIIKYEHQGKVYGAIPTWRKHQHVNCNERKSIIPDPKMCTHVQSLDKHKNAYAPTIVLPEINVQENATTIQEVNTDKADDYPVEAALTVSLNLNAATSTTTSAPRENILEAAPDISSSALEEQCTLMHVHSPYDDRNEYQEKEREKEEEKEREQEKEGVWGRENPISVIDPAIVASEPRPRENNHSLPLSSSKEQVVNDIFAHWQSALGHLQARLDKKRRRVINEALKLGYTAEELKQAISGCALTPFNTGDNERGQRYDGLQLILRDAEHIDRFIANYFSPPQPKTPAQRHTANNMNALNNWVARKQQELEAEELAAKEASYAA
jgi:hypothetical protein